MNFLFQFFTYSSTYFSVRETHQIAAAQQEKNARLREAFGITEHFDESRNGSEAQVDSKKYPILHSPSPSPPRYLLL